MPFDGDDDDDDFGGFEAAPTISNTNELSTNKSGQKKDKQLPDWLIQHSINTSLPHSESHLEDFSIETTQTPYNHNNGNNDSYLVKQLQEELSLTEEHLLDQQTKYLQTQTKHRQEIDDTTNNFNNAVLEFQKLLKQGLTQQKEALTKQFKTQLDQQAIEYDLKLKQKLREVRERNDAEITTRLENKFAEFQDRMIMNYESDLQDLDVKVKRTVAQAVREENISEKGRLKQNFDAVEKEMKNETEKYVQICFMNQSETFKEQIKSGVQQEHLIHKDLINSKLEKLCKSSEDKRRETNLLFNRHMTGLNFFLDNAHKQMGIISQAQTDLLKNKDIIDYYGDINNNNVTVDPISSLGFNSIKPKREESDKEIPDELLLADLT